MKDLQTYGECNDDISLDVSSVTMRLMTWMQLPLDPSPKFYQVTIVNMPRYYS